MEEKKKIILNELINDLGENYKNSDYSVLEKILNDVIVNAFMISNRKQTSDNLSLLSLEICSCVKTIYLQRGTEDVKSSSQSGISSTYKNAMETLRKDIICNRKRVIF